MSKSLRMAESLFNLREFGPEDLDAVYSTVQALSETPTFSFDSLVLLTSTLETLPVLDELPLALAKFLRDTKWPGFFKHVSTPRAQAYQRLIVFLAALTALSTFLTALPDQIKTGVFDATGSFLFTYFVPLSSIVVLFFTGLAILYTLVYWTPLWYVRKFWPRPKAS